ncbi:NAD(P)H-binding protein [Aquincola tertiaricarbonis]|uniref:NAD(P)H-binding protein n=1 Tax=Aquincola tertiaricarbonis TaxID=391953 RepID=A0ABY4SDZ2_AQUTE|nr:NAD-dependent epimerase/dehydratase family protein [Aquincola tertiaricarbonis]URI11536.1 NAD(P)H-binding protein [Aquincola tertiaricarbonis]
MSNRVVLVLGAQGRLGAAAVAAFAASGWRVLAQARRAQAAWPAGVTPVTAALADTEALAAAAAGASVVVYAVNPPYTDWARQLMPLACQGLDVAERLGALFMLPGNVYGYGDQLPAWLQAQTPQHPTHEKGRLRVQLEAEIARRAEAGRLRGVVIRAGDFYGSGRGSWLDLVVLKSLRAGKLVYPGPLDRAHAWAYLPDLARAFVAVAERARPGQAAGLSAVEVLHFEGHTLTGAELLAALAGAADDIGATPAVVARRGWRHGSLPWGLMRAAGIFVPMLKAVAEMRYLWFKPHALDGASLLSCTGALPQTPPRQALRQAMLDLGLAAQASPAHIRSA